MTADRTISGILFDKDGTLLDYVKSWVPVNYEVASIAANGDAALARRLLVAGGMDPDTGHVTPDSLLAAGNTIEIATGMVAAGAPYTVEALTVKLDGLFSNSAAYAVPVTDLPEALPEEVGIDSRALVRLSQWIREHELDVRSLLVVRDGRLVFERYSKGVTRDHNQAIYSVTKSVTSTLIGILVTQGKIDGDKVPVIDLLPAVKGFDEERLAPKRSIQLKHTLWMASGLEWTEHPMHTPIYRAPNRLRVALEPPLEYRPGTRFNYSNADAEMVGAVVHRASGSDALKFAEEHLFKPLGMKNYDWWYPDRTGRYPGGWAMRMRAVDMAKFGLLYLQGGVWGERRIVDEKWLRQATLPGVVPYYGYYWWLGTFGQREYAAQGWKGQYVVVMPELDMVVTLTSVLPADQEHAIMKSILGEHIVPAVRRRPKPIETTEERTQSLHNELELASRTRGKPGQAIHDQDHPQP